MRSGGSGGTDDVYFETTVSVPPAPSFTTTWIVAVSPTIGQVSPRLFVRLAVTSPEVLGLSRKGCRIGIYVERVRLNEVSSSVFWFPMEAKTGASFTAFTVTVIVSLVTSVRVGCSDGQLPEPFQCCQGRRSRHCRKEWPPCPSTTWAAKDTLSPSGSDADRVRNSAVFRHGSCTNRLQDRVVIYEVTVMATSSVSCPRYRRKQSTTLLMPCNLGLG